MEKLNCDIIRDLIPSYADGICSDATKKCVEEHIGTCDGCRRMLESCRHTLSGETLDQKGLDGLRKIKQIMTFHKAVSYALLMFLLYSGFEVFLANNGNYIIFPHSTLLFILCVLANLLAATDFREKNSPGKAEYLSGAVSLLISLYFIILLYYFMEQLVQGAPQIFGRDLIQCGPFLVRQMMAAYVLQTAFFIYNLWSAIRRNKDCGWLLCLNMTGIFLLLKYDIWLKTMLNAESLRLSLLNDTLITLLIGGIGMAATRFLAKRSH